MKSQLKRLFEKLSNEKIWLEHQTSSELLSEFFAEISVKETNVELLRFGGEFDGGYLIPDDLEGIEACISPGVSDEISFDCAMADLGLKVLMADASVDGPPSLNQNFIFTKKFLDIRETESTTRIDTLCNSLSDEVSGDLILQMDIEGAEYKVLLDMSDILLKRFRIMCIEFHSLPKLFSTFSYEIIAATFGKLLRSHEIIHIHPNNCCGMISNRGYDIPEAMEFTFYRKDRASFNSSSTLTFPHPLDFENISDCAPIVLPMCWR